MVAGLRARPLSFVARSGARSGGRPGLQNRCWAVVPSRVGSIPMPLRHGYLQVFLHVTPGLGSHEYPGHSQRLPSVCKPSLLITSAEP